MPEHRASKIVRKRPGEIRKINMQLKQKLAAGETVSAVSDTTVIPSGVLTAIPVTSGTLVQYTIASGTAEKAFTAASSSDTLTSASHGYSNGDTVQVIEDGAANLPTGLSAGTTYYVVNTAANTLQLALTSGGSAVELSADGQGSLVAVYVVRCTATTSDSQTVVCEGECHIRD